MKQYLYPCDASGRQFTVRYSFPVILLMLWSLCPCDAGKKNLIIAYEFSGPDNQRVVSTGCYQRVVSTGCYQPSNRADPEDFNTLYCHSPNSVALVFGSLYFRLVY